MTAAAVASAAGVSEARWRDREQYRPRYNASPGAWLPVLRMSPPAGAEEQHVAEGEEVPEAPRERLLQVCTRSAEIAGRAPASKPSRCADARCAVAASQTMRWGLVPSFTRKDATPNFFRAFNARSDTAADKPMFSRLLSRKRCVVLLNGFYEWRAEGRGSLAVKQPYYLHLATEAEGGDKAAAAQPAAADEDAPEALLRAAALYDRWEGPEGPLYTVTILTTDSAPQLRWLHDRMPVFLRSEAEERAWLVRLRARCAFAACVAACARLLLALLCARC
jgi:putative SOS response-associated peptidase YedK